ncbi:MAG TPA: hypothetical protein VHS99_04605 [Chloroflexota bacterium]|jgi:hypothetical protein|nr:hypothetical protein [Chloroflexota bacterium]
MAPDKPDPRTPHSRASPARPPAAYVPGYSAAEAAHMFEEFLEQRLGHDEFWTWLMSYPPHRPGITPDIGVEDELDRAILVLRAFQHGTRDWPAVARELRDARARLTGLARH